MYLNVIKKFLIIAIVIPAVGCSTFSKPEKVTTTVIETSEKELDLEPRYVGDPFSAYDLGLINKLEPVPEKGHAAILKWVDYFQTRGRHHMERYLQRSTRYLPLMKQILKQEGVPEDLVYISLIESGFNAKAYSPAAAVGYWQFIRPTGKRYNLKIGSFVDERKDPVESTRAAANYFKTLYNMMGSWHLSMASYNTGENRVKRAIRRYKTRSFWDIAYRGRLPRETRNYVPKYLAAMLIADSPSRFGFKNLNYHAELSFDSVMIEHPISIKQLSVKLGVPKEDLVRLNPSLLSDYMPTYKSDRTFVRVPKGYGMAALSAMNDIKAKPPKYVAGNGFTYKIRRGDSLYKISRKFGTTITRLRHENGLRRRSLLRVGQRVRIPARRVKVRAARNSSRYQKNVANGYYRVRSGDNLSVIAKRHRTSVSKIRKLNQLGRRSLIKPGMVLLVKDVNVRPKRAKKATASRASSKSSKVSTAVFHRVRRGDNLTVIAKKYGVTINQLRKWNRLGRRSMIKVGQKIRVKKSVQSTKRSASKKVHVVRRGETLIDIANKYSVTLSRLRQKNSIRRANHLLAGARLVIPQ